MASIFQNFHYNDCDYYYRRGKYYKDNLIIAQVITEEEYKRALFDHMIFS